MHSIAGKHSCDRASQRFTRLARIERCETLPLLTAGIPGIRCVYFLHSLSLANVELCSVLYRHFHIRIFVGSVVWARLSHQSFCGFGSDTAMREAILRRDAREFFLLVETRRSTKGRSSFAFAMVVVMPSCNTSERASERSSAVRCPFSRPNF